MAGELFVSILQQAAKGTLESQEIPDLMFAKAVKGGLKIDGSLTIPWDFIDISKTMTTVLGPVELGDKVVMMRFAKGQRFFVVDKV